MSNNESTIDNIDEVIAYLESPEYLRMVAYQQNEDPSSLLRNSAEPPSPIEWDATEQQCRCYTCRQARQVEDAPVPIPVRMSIRNDPSEVYSRVLSNRWPFTTSTNNLRGVRRPESRTSGYLESAAPHAAGIWAADHDLIDYVVYSFGTPIAWHAAGRGWNEWVFPLARYGRTTTQHQNKIYEALTLTGQTIRTI